MGQYWYIFNLDKKEFLHPHKFGDGLKLMEFGSSSVGTLSGLTLLLASPTGNGRGGGDFGDEGESPEIVGRWAGDRIIISGDYDDVRPGEGRNLYDQASDDPDSPYKDISEKVVRVMLKDRYWEEELRQKDARLSFGFKLSA